VLRQEDTLNLDAVAVAYRTGRATPGSLIKDILSRISERGDDHVWICRVSGEELIARAHWLEVEGQGNLALYGVPFAVKDNIDVEGYPTTAGCPAYSYIAKETAPSFKSCWTPEQFLSAKPILISLQPGWWESVRPMAFQRTHLTPNTFRADQAQGLRSQFHPA